MQVQKYYSSELGLHVFIPMVHAVFPGGSPRIRDKSGDGARIGAREKGGIVLQAGDIFGEMR